MPTVRPDLGAVPVQLGTLDRGADALAKPPCGIGIAARQQQQELPRHRSGPSGRWGSSSLRSYRGHMAQGRRRRRRWA
jgi:hypothetical protein